MKSGSVLFTLIKNKIIKIKTVTGKDGCSGKGCLARSEWQVEEVDVLTVTGPS